MIFENEHRVLPEEVDAFLVVNFSNYLKWSSATFINYLQHKGMGLRFDHGSVEFRVARVNIVYAYSARLDDVVTIRINKLGLKAKSLDANISVILNGKILARARFTYAFVDATDFSLTDTPDELIRAVNEFIVT